MRRVILVLMVGLAGCGSDKSLFGSRDGATPSRLADTAMNAGSPAVALQALDGIIANDPRNTDALLRQGRAHLMLGNKVAAEASFRRALAVDGGLVEAKLGLAKVLMGSNAAEAETMFRAIVESDPKNVTALNNLGVSRDLQGKHALAQDAYRQALEVSPGLASARQNLGLSLAVSGKPEEGVEMLGQMAQDGGNNRRARDNLAVALALTGRTAEAGRVLQEELSPADTTKALAGFRSLQAPAPTPLQ